MQARRTAALFATFAIAAGSFAFAADAPADPIKAAGLTKAATAFVLADDEKAVLDGYAGLKTTKVAADKEVQARKVIDFKVAEKQKVVKDAEKEWTGLEARLAAVPNPEIKNRMIIRMNRLVADQKQALIALKELDEQATKLSTSAKAKFIDDLAALGPKADAATAKYAALANDAAVKAAVAKASPKIPLGPTPEMAAAVADVKKWQGAIESESIPMREQNGTYTVDALLNGEPVRMAVDTGASSITLPFEVAEKLKLVPGERHPTVQLKLANGQVIEGKEMSLEAVRVGRFTVSNVSCIVLQAGLSDPPTLLGNTFLNNFIVKMDQSKGELHLTEVNPTAKKPAAAAGAATKPAGK